jgi:hypothetical protein
VVVAYLYGYASLLWYYPFNALSGVISSVVLFLAYTADVVEPRERTAGFGMIIAGAGWGGHCICRSGGDQAATCLPPTTPVRR